MFLNKPALLHSMVDHRMDAVVVASPAYIVYNTGIDLYTQILVPERLVLNLITADGDSTVITFTRECSMFETASWVEDVRGFAEFGESPLSVLASVLAEKGLMNARVGIEKLYLPVGYAEELRKLMPGLTLTECESMMGEVRAIKTDEEIDHLRTVATWMDKAINLAAGLTRAGDTESTLACRIVSNLMTIAEDEVGTIDGLVASGANLTMAHNRYGTRVIEDGDLVRFGCKARFKGYWCLLLRTGIAGKASQSKKHGYSAYYEAFCESIQNLGPGIRACDAFNRARQAVERRGLTLVSQKVGHCTGTVFRDVPVLQTKDERPLQANMVLAHDFLACDRNGDPYFVEDRVLIAEDGAQLISDVTDTSSLMVLG